MELLEDLAEGGSPIPDYSSIHGFLRKWGVEQLLGLFEEHKIDLEVLPLLDEQTVTELIPQIGVRMKFLNGWRREPQVQNVWDFLQCVVYELPGIARPIVRDMRAFLRRQLSTQA